MLVLPYSRIQVDGEVTMKRTILRLGPRAPVQATDTMGPGPAPSVLVVLGAVPAFITFDPDDVLSAVPVGVTGRSKTAGVDSVTTATVANLDRSRRQSRPPRTQLSARRC